MLPQQYCLRWKYHHSNLQTMFSQLLDRGCFCDVTLACEGQLIRAHRVVLCACSTFFDSVLSNYASERDPIIIMKDVTFAEVKCLIEFMYKGEINVEHASLPSLLKTADDLKIKGLAEVSWRDDEDGPPPPMPAAEFHSPPRSIADSYAQDMLHQHTPQLHAQLHTERERVSERERERERERDRDRLHSPTSATLENALGLSAGSGIGGRMPTLTPLPSAAGNLECATPIDPYLGPKRKRGRPPLDDTYDVFNVRKLAQYAAHLEPTQRAYLESGRSFMEEPQPVVHAASLISPPSATAACPPKQRQRLRHQQQQQQQSQLLQQTPHNAESTERDEGCVEDWPNGGLVEHNGSPKVEELELKPLLDMSNDEAGESTTTAMPLCSVASKHKLDKVTERRERHGKLRHATRRLYERERSSEKAPQRTQRISASINEPEARLEANNEHVADMSPNATLPQPVEEIENEHLVANRAESPAALRSSALLPSSFGGKYPESPGGGGGGAGGGGGYLINDHGMLMAHDFSPSAAAAAAAAAAAVAAVAKANATATAAAAHTANANANAMNGNSSGGGHAPLPGTEHANLKLDYADVKLEDYDAAELRLTNEELSQWQDVIKMDDYLAKGRRPQFWEEPFTKRVLDAIKNKRLEMKKAARILGVSYGTLYGRYREVYGCLKHPYSGTTFRNSVGLSASNAASQLAVQPRFDLDFRRSVLPGQLDLDKLPQKDLSELWTRPQI